MLESKEILIAEDHGLMREGLRQLLESQEGWEVVGEAANGEEAFLLLQAHKPDMLLVDLSMPLLNGIELIEAALSIAPAIRILVVTAHSASSYVYSSLKAGAHGYLLKTEDGENMLRAFHSVMDGNSYLSPDVTGEIIAGYVRSHSQDGAEAMTADLTPRERELAEQILKGDVSNEVLAQKLFVSPKTVQKHKTNIFRKLGVPNTQKLIELFQKSGGS